MFIIKYKDINKNINITNMVDTKNYSIQIDIKNADPEFRAYLYRVLNDYSFKYPDMFQYHTIK